MEDNRPLYSTGDLILIRGEGKHVWEILTVNYSYSYDNGSLEKEEEYLVISVVEEESKIILQEDIILVCKKSHANEYIRLLDDEGNSPVFPAKELLKENDLIPLDDRDIDLSDFRGSDEVDELLDDLIGIFSIRDTIPSIYENYSMSEDVEEIEAMILLTAEEACKK